VAPALGNNIDVSQLAVDAATRSDADAMGLICALLKSDIGRTGENVVPVHYYRFCIKIYDKKAISSDLQYDLAFVNMSIFSYVTLRTALSHFKCIDDSCVPEIATSA